MVGLFLPRSLIQDSSFLSQVYVRIQSVNLLVVEFNLTEKGDAMGN